MFDHITLDKVESFELISIVKDNTLNYLINHPKLSRDALIEASKRQLMYAKNPVFFEIIKNCYGKPIQWLQSTNEVDRKWYDVTIELLAVELTFQFPYYESLLSLFPSQDARRSITQQIYHDFFQMAIKSSQANPNVSFFRALDRARREFANRGDSDERSKQSQFIDLYIGYLRNGEDLLDSELIHLSIFGYVFQDCRLPVMIYTAEDPGLIEARIKYALEILNWASSIMNEKLPKCYGKIFCFKDLPLHKNLSFHKVIDVSLLDYSNVLSMPF